MVILIFTISQTKGHAYKLLTLYSCQINYFSTRVINDWNNLTTDFVETLLNIKQYDSIGLGLLWHLTQKKATLKTILETS